MRRVWFAKPEDVGERVPRLQSRPGAAEFLPQEYDPSQHDVPAEKVPQQVQANQVRWQEPLELDAGTAVWIKRGWWHCFAAEADGVAVPVDIVSGEVRGSAPRVFRCVALSKQSQCGRRISRRPDWGSAITVLKLWSTALAAL